MSYLTVNYFTETVFISIDTCLLQFTHKVCASVFSFKFTLVILGGFGT